VRKHFAARRNFDGDGNVTQTTDEANITTQIALDNDGLSGRRKADRSLPISEARSFPSLRHLYCVSCAPKVLFS
jgi:hypothetical protein